MIKQFIFDIGNVLVDFHAQDYFDRSMPNRNMREVCTLVFNDVWEEMDRGTYLQEEAMRIHLAKHPEYEEQIRYIYAHWLPMMSLKEDTFAFMQALKAQGYKVYLLSNIGEESHHYLEKKYRFFDVADGMVLSYQEKILKPEPQIYQTLLQRYDLNAEECIFLDDNTKNIEAALEMGIHGFVFESVEQVQKEICILC